MCADACGDVAADVDDVDDGAEAHGDSRISSITSNISNICNVSIYISMQSKIMNITSVPATSSAEATSTVAAAPRLLSR